jgi:hypothetical protein
MVLEFDPEEDADHAILNGLVFGAQIYACEYYDRACMAKQYEPTRKLRSDGATSQGIQPNQGDSANQKGKRKSQNARRATDTQRNRKSEKGQVPEKGPKDKHEPGPSTTSPTLN